MRAVDTNVLVRLVIRDEEKQVLAAQRFVERGAWASHVVLAEMSWALSAVYGLEDAQIAMAIEMLLNHATLTVQDADVVLAALDQYRLKPALGFSDCLVLEIARKAGHTPLGTFDKNLSRLDGVERLQ